MVKDQYSVYHFPLDDAWIHQVYARSLAMGQGMAYNPGQQEAGSTSPLWAVVTAPAHWLGPDLAVLGVKLVGVLLGLVSILYLQKVASRLLRRGDSKDAATPQVPANALLATSLFALEPRFLFSTLSGMETILLVALVTAAVHMALEKRPWMLLLLLGLMPTTRPEAVIFLPCAAVAWWLLFIEDGRLKNLRPGRILGALGLPVLPGILWAGFCLYATGHPLPNSFYIKAHPFTLGSPQMQAAFDALTLHGLLPFWAFAVGILGFLGLSVQRPKSSVPKFLAAPWLLFVALPAVYLVAVMGSRMVYLGGYYWSRWLDPATIPLTAASCVGLGFLLDFASKQTDRRAMKISIALVVLVAIVGSLPYFLNSFLDRRGHLSSDSRAIAIVNVQMGKWVAENTPEDAVIGVNDAGALRYFGDRYTLDLLGLNQAPIAFKEVSTQDGIDRSDWLVIFPEWFYRRQLLTYIRSEFEPRMEVRIPVEEYTLFNSPAQTVKVAYEKRSADSQGTE